MTRTNKKRRGTKGIGAISYAFGSRTSPPIALDPSLKTLVEDLSKVPVSYQKVADMIFGNEIAIVKRAKAILNETCPSINTNAATILFNEQQMLGADSTGAAIVRPCLNIGMGSTYNYLSPEGQMIQGSEMLFTVRIPFVPNQNAMFTIEADAVIGTPTSNVIDLGFNTPNVLDVPVQSVESIRFVLNAPTSFLAINDTSVAKGVALDENEMGFFKYLLMNSQNIDIPNVFYEEGSGLLPGSKFMDILVDALAMAIGEVVALEEILSLDSLLNSDPSAPKIYVTQANDSIFQNPTGIVLSRKDYLVKGREALLVASMLPEAHVIYQLVDIFTRDIFNQISAGVEVIISTIKNIARDPSKSYMDIGNIITELVLDEKIPDVSILSIGQEQQIWTSNNFVKLLAAKAVKAQQEGIQIPSVAIQSFSASNGAAIDPNSIGNVFMDSLHCVDCQIEGAASNLSSIAAIPLDQLPSVMDTLQDNFQVGLTQSISDGLTYNLNVFGLSILAQRALAELNSIKPAVESVLLSIDFSQGPVDLSLQVPNVLATIDALIYGPCVPVQELIFRKSHEVEASAEAAAVAIDQAQELSTSADAESQAQVEAQLDIADAKTVEATDGLNQVINQTSTAKEGLNQAIDAIKASNMPEDAKNVAVEKAKAVVEINDKMRSAAEKAKRNAEQLKNQKNKLKDFNKKASAMRAGNSIAGTVFKLFVGGALTYGTYHYFFKKKSKW